MSEIEVPHVVGVPDPDEPSMEDGSILGRLREQHRTVVTETTADFDIPGYEGSLFARYRVLDNKELDDIRRKVRQETKNPSEQVTLASLDTLIAACDEFFARDGDREIPLREVAGEDSPIRFGPELAEALGFEGTPTSARDVVTALFGFNLLAAQAHSAMVSQWMLKINIGADGQLGGI